MERAMAWNLKSKTFSGHERTPFHKVVNDVCFGGDRVVPSFCSTRYNQAQAYIWIKFKPIGDGRGSTGGMG